MVRASAELGPMTKPSAPAFPTTRDLYGVIPPGLTKRELFAAMAMQGLCLKANVDYQCGPGNDPIAKRAVTIADALLKALEQGRDT